MRQRRTSRQSRFADDGADDQESVARACVGVVVVRLAATPEVEETPVLGAETEVVVVGFELLEDDSAVDGAGLAGASS